MQTVINLKTEKQTLIVLHSFEDFKKWYLRFFDLSIFAEGEVSALLNEGKPEHYPCIPLILDKNMNLIFFDATSVNCWCEQLKSLTLKHKH
ncbi:hypothetical protein V5K00_RS23535 [Enterobacter asburiae]